MPARRWRRRGKWALASTLLTALFLFSASAAPMRVVIVPFSANAPKDVSFLVKGVRDMLASRLTWEGKVQVVEADLLQPVLAKVSGPLNEAKARQVAAELDAQVVVFGSMTVLGKAVSIDAKVVKLSQPGTALAASITAPNLDQVIPRINNFALRINAKLFKRPEAVAALQAQEKKASAQGAPKATSGGAVDPLTKLPPNISPLNPLFRRTLTGVESDRYWRSPRIPHAVQSIAVDDIDLDGRNELLVLLPRQLLIYRLAKGYFARINQFKGGPSGEYLFVDTCDTDGDGRPEIFVANLNDKSLNSFVLVAEKGTLRMKARGLPYYFRAQPDPAGKGKILLGQRNLIDIPFTGPVYRMKAKGESYEPERALTLPRLANIFNSALVDLSGGGKSYTILVDNDHQLRVYNPSGREAWVGGDAYQASAKFIPYTPVSGSGFSDEGWDFIPSRIVVTDLDKDGRQEVVVVQNRDRMSNVLERLKLFYRGTIFGMDWNGMQLVRRWRTHRFGGYLSDYAIADVGNVGRPALVIAIGQRTSHGLSTKGWSHVVAFTLKPKSIKKREKPRKQGL